MFMSTERRNPSSVDIDLFPTERVLRIINAEDASVSAAVANAIPEIAKLVDIARESIRAGGHVIYAGAGTSGRIALTDAAEIPPTFSAPADWIQAVIAGGVKALTRATEGSEDEVQKAAVDLRSKKLTKDDLVIGIAATGTTPYTLAALEFAKSRGSKTAAIVCAENTAMSKLADITVHVVVGAEVITGSTRMKAGTAQKLVLNMFSTALMIRLGMTYSNWMINVSMTNQKLRERGKHILEEILGVPASDAEKLVEASEGNLKIAVIMGATGCDRDQARNRLDAAEGNLRGVLGHLGSGRE
jgi:N-acetylmuramic acid 6-phosphate etherase